ncbi:MAG: hypothetical protein Kow00120_29540 [Anaerolineae bacterium]
MQFVYVPYLSTHAGAEMSVRGSLCALQFGKFWETHDRYFTAYGQFGPSAFSEERVIQTAAEMGIPESDFIACLYSAETENLMSVAANIVSTQREAGNFSGTPTVLINGENPFAQGLVPRWNEVRSVIERAAQ